jgi:hypothetical protein
MELLIGSCARLLYLYLQNLAPIDRRQQSEAFYNEGCTFLFPWSPHLTWSTDALSAHMHARTSVAHTHSCSIFGPQHRIRDVHMVSIVSRWFIEHLSGSLIGLACGGPTYGSPMFNRHSIWRSCTHVHYLFIISGHRSRALKNDLGTLLSRWSPSSLMAFSLRFPDEK